MSESEDSVRLHNPTLKELLRVCEDLCHELRVPYDPYKLRITTDYGTKVVVRYKDSEFRRNL